MVFCRGFWGSGFWVEHDPGRLICARIVFRCGAFMKFFPQTVYCRGSECNLRPGRLGVGWCGRLLDFLKQFGAYAGVIFSTFCRPSAQRNPTVSGLKGPKCRNAAVVKLKWKKTSCPGNTGRGHVAW